MFFYLCEVSLNLWHRVSAMKAVVRIPLRELFAGRIGNAHATTITRALNLIWHRVGNGSVNAPETRPRKEPFTTDGRRRRL